MIAAKTCTRGLSEPAQVGGDLTKEMGGFFTTLSFARWLAGNPCGGLSKEEGPQSSIWSPLNFRFTSRLSRGRPVS